MNINENNTLSVSSIIPLYEQNFTSGVTETTDTTPLYKFPDTFLWGTATAAHQVESDNKNKNLKR